MTTAERTADLRPQVWPAFVGFGAAVMVSQLVGGVVLGLMFVAGAHPTLAMMLDPELLGRAFVSFMSAPATVLTAAAVSTLTLAGTALVGARLAKTPAAVRLRLGPSRLGWGRTAVAAAGSVALSWAFSALISLTGLGGIGVLELFDNVFTGATPTVLVLALLAIGIGAPLGEELFFRGFMQTRLVERWSRPAAIAMTAAAFGLLHMDPIQGPFAFLAGLYLGWLTERAGSIRPAILAHATNNCLSVLSARFLVGTPSRTADLVTLAISLGVLGAALFTLRPRDP